MFINRFGKIYNTKPNTIETIDLINNSLDFILEEYDNLPRTKFEYFDKSTDIVRKYIKAVKIAIEKRNNNEIINDINIAFIIDKYYTHIEESMLLDIPELQDLLCESYSKTANDLLNSINNSISYSKKKTKQTKTNSNPNELTLF